MDEARTWPKAAKCWVPKFSDCPAVTVLLGPVKALQFPISHHHLPLLSHSPLAMGQTSSQPQVRPVQMPASLPPMGDHHHASSSSGSPPPGCPMHEKAAAPPPAAAAAKCPVQHDSPSTSSGVNPQNNMPNDLTHMQAPGQSMELPIERVISSIPRPSTPDEEQAAGSGKWEYPSPQQFYNALVRKGWETPEEHVETMVEIHNFLNEEAWNEVLKWEKRWSG